MREKARHLMTVEKEKEKESGYANQMLAMVKSNRPFHTRKAIITKLAMKISKVQIIIDRTIKYHHPCQIQ